MPTDFIQPSIIDWSAVAARVQAIGSIIAIGVAIAVPANIDKRNRNFLNKDKENRAKALALSILPSLYKLSASTNHFITERETNDPESMIERDILDGNFFVHSPELRSLLSISSDLGDIQYPFSRLILLLFRAEEMLNMTTRLQRGGYHAAWINNIDGFIDQAKNINAATNDLIEKIEKLYNES